MSIHKSAKHTHTVVHICTHVPLHTQTHTHTHICIHMYTHRHTHTPRDTDTHTDTHTHTHERTHACTHTYTSIGYSLLPHLVCSRKWQGSTWHQDQVQAVSPASSSSFAQDLNNSLSKSKQ